MKMDSRISLASLVLLVSTAAAQNAPSTVPQSPPPPTYPSQQNQSPPPPQYPQAQPVPPPAPYSQPQWVRESSYADSNGFHYHPFRFHIDGGGTLTQQTNETFIDNGWNAGAGFTWYPTSHLPLGIRLDGTYNEFRGRGALLEEASAAYQTRINNATEKVWGGDADLELDIPFSQSVRLYLLAGGGWYKQQNTYRDRFFSDGFDCFPFGCGRFGGNGVVARTESDWHFARNAGAGLEFATGPRTSFFVEARYMRIDPNSAKNDFIPIRAGFRF